MNKHFIAGAVAALAAFNANALKTGDIAFTAFNADKDGWSIVALAPIAANTQIYFSDSTALSATVMGHSEATLLWTTGLNPINAGTVVHFLVDGVVGTETASVGSFSNITSLGSTIGSNSETIYAYLGTSATAVTTMLTAVSSEFNDISLTTVGLTAGTNAIKLTASTDFAGYTGNRSGQVAFVDYAPLVNNPANWAIDVNGNGNSVIPSSVAFTITPVPEPGTYALMGAGLGAVGFTARRRRSA